MEVGGGHNTDGCGLVPTWSSEYTRVFWKAQLCIINPNTFKEHNTLRRPSRRIRINHLLLISALVEICDQK